MQNQGSFGNSFDNMKEGAAQIGGAVAETEDVHLVLLREMANFIKSRDFVAAIRWKRYALTHKENSHRQGPRDTLPPLQRRTSAPASPSPLRGDLTCKISKYSFCG